MKNRRIFALLFAVFLVLSLFAGCGSKSTMSNDMHGQAKPGSDVMVNEDLSAGSSLPNQQKLIRTISMNAETEALDTLLENVESRVKELGGYVEKKEVYMGSSYATSVYRSASMTLRIPAEKADIFAEKVGEAANIVSSSENVEDVTLQYVATESRITALETEQARLLELLAKSTNMGDLLQIEARLTEVRAELEKVTSLLRRYDNLVDYATIKLSVSEVREYTQPKEELNFFQRIGSGLAKSFKNVWNFLVEFVVFLITSLPYLMLIGAVLTAVLLVAKKRKARKKAAAKEKTQE